MMKPLIILVKPQLAENIGMVERAMLNFGFTDLALVNPRDEFPSPESEGASAGAHDILAKKITLHTDIKSAIANCHLVIATSVRNREQAISFYDLDASFTLLQKSLERGDRVAVLFGPERTGLDNNDLCHAHHAITFPTNPDFPSLNLADSVLLFCYLWNQYGGQLNHRNAIPAFSDSATAESREFFIEKLLTALEQKDFFKSPKMKPALSRNIRQMITRANFSAQEIRTWHGIIATLLEKKQ